jgi:hypothetical protein
MNHSCPTTPIVLSKLMPTTQSGTGLKPRSASKRSARQATSAHIADAGVHRSDASHRVSAALAVIFGACGIQPSVQQQGAQRIPTLKPVPRERRSRLRQLILLACSAPLSIQLHYDSPTTITGCRRERRKTRTRQPCACLQSHASGWEVLRAGHCRVARRQRTDRREPRP